MNAKKRARVEAQRKDQVLRALQAGRRLFGEGGWMNRTAVVRCVFGTQNVTWYLGLLERAGTIEHRTLRGESQWRAKAEPTADIAARQDQAGPEPAEGDPTP